jgi:hypothetical protein
VKERFLIALAIVGLYQAVFMANADGAWDNAKKVVETELRAKGTELHATSVATLWPGAIQSGGFLSLQGRRFAPTPNPAGGIIPPGPPRV